MSLPNFNRLISSHAASDSSASTASAIVHVPRYGEPLNESGTVGASPVDLRDEVAQRFGRYYQRFVGYPAGDFQLPANTTVRYSLLQHAGTHPWETPAFKAGVAGFGGVVTTLSVGLLLSDTIQTPLVTDPLDYTLVSQSVDDDQEDAVTEALKTNMLTVGDRPVTLNLLEFSPSPDSAADANSVTDQAEPAAPQPELTAPEPIQSLSDSDPDFGFSPTSSSVAEQSFSEHSFADQFATESSPDTVDAQISPLSVADHIRDYNQTPPPVFAPDQQQITELGQNFPLTDHQLSQRLAAS